MATKKVTEDTIQIVEMETQTVTFHVLGTTPIICNRMSEKARQQLLLPSGRKTAAEKAGSMKHDPLTEYRSSPYRMPQGNHATELSVLATQFKGALRNAALDMPGAKKSQIGRLTTVESERLELFGVPKIFSSITRSADINKTPDVRTRAIVPKWACKVDITYVRPVLNPTVISNLFATAGITMGVGDWRPEKGSGNYGRWKIVDANDPEFLEVIKTGGKAAQLEALENPEAYDDDTEELLSWFNAETKRRGLKVA